MNLARAAGTIDRSALMEPTAGPMSDEEAAAAMRLLMKKGVLGSAVFQVQHDEAEAWQG
ncbi:MAG TPA: hypothetical protein VFO19_07730 [Vicinamibacterales bacterium]|nr:hypothetical protein [Vicinamibacterales bacterium]